MIGKKAETCFPKNERAEQLSSRALFVQIIREAEKTVHERE